MSPREKVRVPAHPPARRRAARSASAGSDLVIGTEDASLLDIVDNVLAKGVVLTGEVTIGLAQVDLIYLRLSLLLCAADRVLTEKGAGRRDHTRHVRRKSARNA